MRRWRVRGMGGSHAAAPWGSAGHCIACHTWRCTHPANACCFRATAGRASGAAAQVKATAEAMAACSDSVNERGRRSQCRGRQGPGPDGWEPSSIATWLEVAHLPPGAHQSHTNARRSLRRGAGTPGSSAGEWQCSSMARRAPCARQQLPTDSGSAPLPTAGAGGATMDSDDEELCPLCCTELDVTDRAIQYCECGCEGRGARQAGARRPPPPAAAASRRRHASCCRQPRALVACGPSALVLPGALTRCCRAPRPSLPCCRPDVPVLLQPDPGRGGQGQPGGQVPKLPVQLRRGEDQDAAHRRGAVSEYRRSWWAGSCMQCAMVPCSRLPQAALLPPPLSVVLAACCVSAACCVVRQRCCTHC